MFASVYKPQGIKSLPRSQQNLEEATGVQVRRQYRFNKIAKVRAIPNPKVVREGGTTKIATRVAKTANGTYRFPDKLPNTYYSKQQASTRGMLGKVRKALKKRSLESGEAQTISRLYFVPKTIAVLKDLGTSVILKKEHQTAQARLRACKNKGERSYYLLPNNERIIWGRLEWCTELTLV